MQGPAHDAGPRLMLVSGEERKSVFRRIDQLVFGYPRHHGAQLGAHFLDLVGIP
jgi:hypothetical protein